MIVMKVQGEGIGIPLMMKKMNFCDRIIDSEES